VDNVSLKGLGYKQSFNNVLKRYSRPYDTKYYSNLAPDKKYSYKQIDSNTGVLSIHDFGIGGNADDPEHKRYAAFLDSIFINIKTNDLKNLIVDVRINSGGTDPNDVITYSYLTSRNFQESKEAWISFQKLPFLKYYDSPFPRFIRPLCITKIKIWRPLFYG
jgi:hypothetical protein